MSEPDPDNYRCAGCGQPAPYRVKACNCPTQVVVRTPGNRGEWCIRDPYAFIDPFDPLEDRTP